ncbi:MAG: sulfite reductase beta subunit-like hemoprotein, partial [Pirellulaceae bacterium]
PILQSLEAKLLTTFGACGDVARSVMCPPLSHLPDTAARQIRSLSIELGKVFLPSAKSYFELWMDDVPVVGTVESEPIYGQTYLPHKFKIAIGLPSDNSVDLLSHDVGLLAIVEHEQLQGFNVYVGGGQAYHPDKSDTFPKLGDLLGYVEAKHIVQVAVGLAELYRDHGERSDRRTRRFKYLVQRLGIERVAIELESILGEQMLLPARQVSIEKTRTLIGWETQSNGRLSVGIPVQGGRISADLRDQLRSVLNVLKCGVCVTAQQNLILVDIDESQRELLAGLRDVIESRSASLVASTMACPALLSCRLALGDAESIAIELQQEIATQLELAGRQDSPIDVRVSGCGNGCSRPITAEIGILAVEKGVYTIRLGGCRLGNRLNMVYKSMVEKSQLSRETGDIVKRYCEEAMGDESLGDFYYRRLSDDR